MTPYYQDEAVTLHLGRAEDVIHALRPRVDAVFADPPYGETNLAWDRWPDGWLDLAATCSSSLWCWGSLRLWGERWHEFSAAGWRYAQDVVWEKHNGTNPTAAGRFRRVHEIAVQWYRGAWSRVHAAPVVTMDAVAKTVRSKRRPPHWNEIDPHLFASIDGGPRIMGSVMYVRSCHGRAIHPTQKPEGALAPLIEQSVPPGGLLLDLFAGSCTASVVARAMGRQSIAIEADEAMAEKAARRLSQQHLVPPLATSVSPLATTGGA